jgi:hypothetical protein
MFSRTLTAMLAAAILILAGLPANLHSQDRVTERPELRNWSIQVFGGTSMARNGTGFSPFTGSTGVKSDVMNPSFGAGLEYMFNPSLSASFRYMYSAIENDDDYSAYENTYQAISAGLNVYFMNLTSLDRGNAWFNPYVSFFGGFGRSEWSGLEGLPDRVNEHGHYGFGAGTRIRMGSTLELSLDYTHQIFGHGHNIDGYPAVSGSFDSDRLAGFTAGLVFNLGSSRRPHSRWYSPEQDIREWRRSVDYAISGREDEWDRILSDLDSQDERLAQLNREMQEKASQRDLEEARRTIEMLEAQLDEMGAQFDGDIQRIDRIHEAAGIAHLTKTLEPGFYIQTYAAWSTRFTHRALEMTRDGLARRGYEIDRLSFFVYQLPNGLYTVQIGNLSSIDEADDVLTGVLDIFDDSFIHRLESDR